MPSNPQPSIPEQISLLRERGMSFTDKAQAEQILFHINFHRLREYWAPDGGEGKFEPNTRFEDALALYRFDEDIRNLLLRYIDKLEISLRARLVHCFAVRFGDPLSYRNGAHFDDIEYWQHSGILAKLDDDIKKKSKDAGASRAPQPVWTVAEAMSFGQLSFWIRRLRDKDAVAEMANAYNVPEIKPFTSFIRSASALRNICAHQNRLVYQERAVLPPARPKRIDPVLQSWNDGNNKAYNLLTFLSYVMRHIDANLNLGEDLQTLSDKRQVSLYVLGFPRDWKSKPVWAKFYPPARP